MVVMGNYGTSQLAERRHRRGRKDSKPRRILDPVVNVVVIVVVVVKVAVDVEGSDYAPPSVCQLEQTLEQPGLSELALLLLLQVPSDRRPGLVGGPAMLSAVAYALRHDPPAAV